MLTLTTHEKIGYKIREAQTQKIPFALVVGEKEIQENAVNVRRYGEQKTETVSYEDFEQQILQEIREKMLRK